MTTPTNAMVGKVAVVNLASRQTQMGIALPAMGKALNTLHLMVVRALPLCIRIMD